VCGTAGGGPVCCGGGACGGMCGGDGVLLLLCREEDRAFEVMGRSSKNFSRATGAGGCEAWGEPGGGRLGGATAEFKLVLLGGGATTGGGAPGAEELRCVWLIDGRSLGLTTSIGRSYGDV